MNNYIMIDMFNDKYNYYIICLSYKSILTYYKNIEEKIKNTNGKILFDQILITGNNDNRFFSCDYIHGKIIFKNAKNEIVDEKYKLISNDIFKNNMLLIKNSTLNENQIESLLNNYNV